MRICIIPPSVKLRLEREKYSLIQPSEKKMIFIKIKIYSIKTKKRKKNSFENFGLNVSFPRQVHL